MEFDGKKFISIFVNTLVIEARGKSENFIETPKGCIHLGASKDMFSHM
jgi:hypothetical protein